MNIKPLSAEARARLDYIKENGTDHFFNLHEDIAEILNHVASLPPMYAGVSIHGDKKTVVSIATEPPFGPYSEIIHLNTGDIVRKEGE